MHVYIHIGTDLCIQVLADLDQVLYPWVRPETRCGRLVVSTPPNAIAFQTGFITQRDLLCFGGSLGYGCRSDFSFHSKWT